MAFRLHSFFTVHGIIWSPSMSYYIHVLNGMALSTVKEIWLHACCKSPFRRKETRIWIKFLKYKLYKDDSSNFQCLKPLKSHFCDNKKMSVVHFKPPRSLLCIVNANQVIVHAKYEYCDLLFNQWLVIFTKNIKQTFKPIITFNLLSSHR